MCFSETYLRSTWQLSMLTVNMVRGGEPTIFQRMIQCAEYLQHQNKVIFYLMSKTLVVNNCIMYCKFNSRVQVKSRFLCFIHCGSDAELCCRVTQNENISTQIYFKGNKDLYVSPDSYVAAFCVFPCCLFGIGEIGGSR